MIVVIDTLRADRLPCYGYKRDTAPFICSLAERGVLFERAFSASSYTAPATASIFTSVYPSRHGVITGLRAVNKLSKTHGTITINRIPDELMTIGELYEELEYDTFAVADNPNIRQRMGFSQGIDRFTTFRYEGAEQLNAKVLEWRQELEAAERSLLYLHYMDPHKPYHRRAPWYTEEKTQWRIVRNAYNSEISYVDHHLAELSSTLGWDRDTVIIVLSDHGEEFQDHGDSGHGKTLYREVIHVPFIVVVPEWQPRTRVSEAVTTVDLLPTLAELHGVPARPEWEGRSLVPLMMGLPFADRPLFGELLRRPEDSRPIAQSVLLGGKHLIRGAGRDRSVKLRELYDLDQDFDEQENLYESTPALVSRLGETLDAFAEAAPTSGLESLELEMDAATIEHLRSLGYVQ